MIKLVFGIAMGGDITHKRWKKQRIATRAKILEYLYALPLIIELSVNGKKYRLVHGKSPSVEELSCVSLEELKRDIVWGRVKADESGPENITIIFGHTRTSHYHDCDPLRIWHGENLIGIDCGAAYPEGRLACLRLDDMREFYSDC